MSRRREIQFQPGYDHREAEKGKPPGLRYGCHGLEMRWLLHGEDVTVQFVVYTGWLPSWVEKHEWGPMVKHDVGESVFPPMAADLGHHSDSPVWEGEEFRPDCDVRPGGCYYDGSGVQAEELLAALLTEGHEAVWVLLETYADELEAEARAAS